MMSFRQLALELVQGTAVGATRFTSLVNRYRYPRVPIPQGHAGSGTIQWQVFGGYFYIAQLGVFGLHILSLKRVPASRHIVNFFH